VCDGQTRGTVLGSRNRRDARVWRQASEGDDMKTEAQSDDRDREAATGRFPFALYVVAELLCTGALVAWLLL
jgi:hypothetical protein